MRITNLRIQNYRGLRDVDIPISQFGCLIGENNAGKSSVLQALSLFLSGSSLAPTNYFDEAADIRIEAKMNVDESDIARLNKAHRERIAALILDGRLTLVRIYGEDGKSKLKVRKKIPCDERFSPDAVDELTKNGRAGVNFCNKVIDTFPELSGKMTTEMRKAEAKRLIDNLATDLPEGNKKWVDTDLPTGIDSSVKSLFPEPIYIPAVKDLADDIKTKESATFGKILKILLDAIEPELARTDELFATLNEQLNRVVGEDGEESDNRLEQVKLIESRVESNLRESFPHVQLRMEIPPPDIKTVLNSAQLTIDDGVPGDLNAKGDGLRRSVIFAILRAYVEISTQKTLDIDADTQPQADVNNVSENNKVDSPEHHYLLLFEEPELFLHPTAQQVLFSTLGQFAQKHTVLVTTHSPVFYGPDATATFIKLSKRRNCEIAPKPYTVAKYVDLSDVKAKDQFQMICFENNNAAFFANTVVLVEGDSDYLVFPHLAKTINPEWDWMKRSVRFARIGGKTSIRRYCDFFRRFDIRVLVIADLDLLIGGFEQTDPCDKLKQLRERLLQAIDSHLAEEGAEHGFSSNQVRKTQNSGMARAMWHNAKSVHQKYQDGSADFGELAEAVDSFFAIERKSDRLDILKEPPTDTIRKKKHALLNELRKRNIHVLDRGDIEAYYPQEIARNQDKPTMAQCVCEQIIQPEQARQLCETVATDDGQKINEFELIFTSIFGNPQ